MVASLEHLSADAQHSVVARAIAGAMVVMALGCCRFAQFQRSGTFLPSTNVEDGTAGFYVATCLKDKDPSLCILLIGSSRAPAFPAILTGRQHGATALHHAPLLFPATLC